MIRGTGLTLRFRRSGVRDGWCPRPSRSSTRIRYTGIARVDVNPLTFTLVLLQGASAASMSRDAWTTRMISAPPGISRYTIK